MTLAAVIIAPIVWMARAVALLLAYATTPLAVASITITPISIALLVACEKKTADAPHRPRLVLALGGISLAANVPIFFACPSLIPPINMPLFMVGICTVLVALQPHQTTMIILVTLAIATGILVGQVGHAIYYLFMDTWYRPMYEATLEKGWHGDLVTFGAAAFENNPREGFVALLSLHFGVAVACGVTLLVFAVYIMVAAVRRPDRSQLQHVWLLARAVAALIGFNNAYLVPKFFMVLTPCGGILNSALFVALTLACLPLTTPSLRGRMHNWIWSEEKQLRIEGNLMM